MCVPALPALPASLPPASCLLVCLCLPACLPAYQPVPAPASASASPLLLLPLLLPLPLLSSPLLSSPAFALLALPCSALPTNTITPTHSRSCSLSHTSFTHYPHPHPHPHPPHSTPTHSPSLTLTPSSPVPAPLAPPSLVLPIATAPRPLILVNPPLSCRSIFPAPHGSLLQLYGSLEPRRSATGLRADKYVNCRPFDHVGTQFRTSSAPPLIPSTAVTQPHRRLSSLLHKLHILALNSASAAPTLDSIPALCALRA